jgi:type II secretory pathway pseudopilin PulG
MASRARAISDREAGFTMIEVVVAAFCVALIIAASATLFVTGNNSSLGAQRQSAVTAVADQQIEQIRQAVKTSGFSALAMSAAPAAGSSATLPYGGAPGAAVTRTDPNYFATTKAGCGASNAEFAVETNYDNTNEGTATSNEPTYSGCDAGDEPLIIQSGGIVTPSQTVSVGTETATVDSFVTQTNLGCNSSLGSGSCSNDARRVVVGVQLNQTNTNSGAGPSAPTYLSTIFTNPIPTNAPNSSVGITLGLGIG